MTFDVAEYHAFIKLLYEHPEWRAEVRQLVLSEEILTLPAVVRELSVTVRELAEAQKRTEQRVEELAEAQKRTEQRVEELAEAQKRTEERLTRLETVVAELAEAQKRTEERLTRLETVVAELAEAQKRTEQRVEELAEAQKRTEQQVQRLTDRVGLLSGDMLEIKYRERASSFFGGILYQAQAMDWNDVEPLVEEHLTKEELNDLRRLDLAVRGRLRQVEKKGARRQAWLAVEISRVIDRGDVERVLRRAEWMRKAGLLVLPVAAGGEITKEAKEVAEQERVVLQMDGQMQYVEEALQRWVKEAGR